jgi:isopentenyl diphosphate isomerase/L-lactate dehydrogenase-like FMN-dependent dehydrogenase
MAVGSQYAALVDPTVCESYQIVRQVNPDGVLFANLGAHVSPDEAAKAVAMIGADALQIHLNAAQELAMVEGDRNFTGYLANIAAIAASCPVPVIVKEVGFGVAREQAAALVAAGVRASMWAAPAAPTSSLSKPRAAPSIFRRKRSPGNPHCRQRRENRLGSPAVRRPRCLRRHP